MHKESPIIIHLPHSSTYIPSDIRNEILLSDDSLQSELLKVTDLYTDELFGDTNFTYVTNQYSRLVFDPERFRDDSKESMSQFGLGAIYEKTSDGDILRSISHSRKEQLLQEFYDPYHKIFEEKVQNLLDIHGKCLIIDAHSFSSTVNDSKNIPSICIGTDDFHTPSDLAEFAMKFFSIEHNFDTKSNYPYAGSLVPIKYYCIDERVSTIMVEINRSIYMDETNGKKTLAFDFVQNIIRKFLINLGDIR